MLNLVVADPVEVVSTFNILAHRFTNLVPLGVL